MLCSPRRPWSRAPDFRLEDNLAVEKSHWVFETLSTAKDYAQFIICGRLLCEFYQRAGCVRFGRYVL